MSAKAEAPKEIWLDLNDFYVWDDGSSLPDGAVKYIRADLVGEAIGNQDEQELKNV